MGNERNVQKLELKNASVGQIIKFGMYEQDKIPNGKKPIEWRVLEKRGNRILIISEKVLDCQPYNTSDRDVIWENCSLRSWLNEKFLNSAFTAEERSQIENKRHYSDGIVTTDKVFLLSFDEAWKYFPNIKAKMCVATAYAKARTDPYNICTKGGKSTCRWWLREQGIENCSAIDIRPDGIVYYCGQWVGNRYVGVRPALWITLES